MWKEGELNMTMSRRRAKNKKQKTCKIIYTITAQRRTFNVRTNNARVTTKAMRKHLEGGKKTANREREQLNAKQSKGGAERKSVVL
jgi:hypothetical protein